MLGAVALTCNPATWETELGGLQSQGQPEKLSKTLTQHKKRVWKCSSEVEQSLGSIPPTTEKGFV